MNWFKKLTLIGLTLSLLLGSGLPAAADECKDWRKDYPTISMGVITSENEADRAKRWTPVRDYLARQLGVEVKWRTATDYAGVIEAMKSKKIQLAWFGPASFAKCWLVTKGQVEPLLMNLNNDGSDGYYSVIIVKTDSSYQKLEDLKGKKLAFADPNSTSGHQAPRFFLTKAGHVPEKFFGKVAFSGSHENSVIGLLNDTFDCAATWWANDARSNMSRMEGKGMIKPGQWRIIWKSAKLPNDPWTMPLWLPERMRKDVQSAIAAMPALDKEAWKTVTDGKAGGLRLAMVEDYKPIIEFVEFNLKARKSR